MKTFRWTFPEATESRAEVREHAQYKSAHGRKLSRSEEKFISRWAEERMLGRRTFRRKMLLRSCLALSLITGCFLLLKLAGVIGRDASLISSTIFITLTLNVLPALPTWAKNEKRFKKLKEQQQAP